MISIGFNPVWETYKLINLLDKFIDKLISKLNIVGIDTTKLDINCNHIFILDTTNGRIITPSTENIQVGGYVIDVDIKKKV